MANIEAAKTARLVPISLPTPHIRVLAAQATAVPIQAIADIAGTGLLMSLFLRVITETGRTAQPVPTVPPTPHIRVTVERATLAPIRAQADIATMVLLT